MKEMYHEGCDANLVLVDPTSNKAKHWQELYALNVLLVDKWTKRELAHLQLSAALEDVLHMHAQQNTESVADADLKMSLSTEWSSVQKG